MLIYLNCAPEDEPVIRELGEFDQLIAKNQPQYQTIRGLCAMTQNGEVLTRFTLTDNERKAIADGADIFVEELTFRRGFTPLRVFVGKNPDPDYFREQYRLVNPNENGNAQ